MNAFKMTGGIMLYNYFCYNLGRSWETYCKDLDFPYNILDNDKIK